MIELTTAHISGVIAAGVFVVRLFLPTAICWIVVGQLPESSRIVSWSVISRMLHSSYWPVILGGDTAAGAGVDRKVQFYGWLLLFSSAIVSISGIVTPLGLYDELRPEESETAIQFRYQPDTSSFGRATNSRAGYKTLRICYGEKGCPGAPENISPSKDMTETLSVWPGSVSLFTSGDYAHTVNSLFDIEWRSFRTSTSILINVTGSPFSKGYYRQIDQLILDDGIRLVEGLLVDTDQGRIGFRNHTAPVGIKHGAMWVEDLLFVEPVTRCVDTNISFEYTLTGEDDSESSSSQQWLVDRGGFAKLNHTVPDISSDDFQIDPALYDRAYSGAWRHNMLLMQYLNITTNGSDGSAPFSYMNSHIGSRFNASGFETSYFTSGSLVSNKQYGIMLDLPSIYGLSDTMTSPFIASNPFNVTYEDAWRLGQEACRYPSLGDQANISAVGTTCGIIFGVADRIDGGDPMVQETNSKWRTPVYSCAAATLTAVREASFQSNGTSGLDRTVVSKINDKMYPSVTEMPLWGMELLDNLTIANATPLWGIVSPAIGKRSDISTIQREHLWLPGILNSEQALDITTMSATGSNLAGNVFYRAALESLFALDPGNTTPFSSRYSGRLDAALHARWLNLSQTTQGVELMLNLIWTDLAANSVVGTRGWTNPSKSETVNVPVHLVLRTVKYHYLYSIPAGISLGLLAILMVISIVFLSFRRSTVQIMRDYLARTSPGRIMGYYLYPERCGILSSTETWTRIIGHETVLLPGKAQVRDEERPMYTERKNHYRRSTI